jgi:protein-tyrosine phosphatase
MTSFSARVQPDWQGSFNLADVGGLPLRDGGFTRPGRVFRSGRPDYVTPTGWRAARAAGVTTVIDLRNVGEAEHTSLDTNTAANTDANTATRNTSIGANLETNADTLASIRFIACPTEDPDDPQFIEICGPWLDHPLSYPDNVRLYPDKFVSVFREIAGAEAAVLVHCAAGRDRTGMVIAMLLHLACVTPEAIADDYAAAMIRFNAGLGVVPGLTGETPHSAEVMEERIASRRHAMLDWLASLDVGAYLHDAGLSESEVDSVKNRLR